MHIRHCKVVGKGSTENIVAIGEGKFAQPGLETPSRSTGTAGKLTALQKTAPRQSACFDRTMGSCDRSNEEGLHLGPFPSLSNSEDITR